MRFSNDFIVPLPRAGLDNLDGYPCHRSLYGDFWKAWRSYHRGEVALDVEAAGVAKAIDRNRRAAGERTDRAMSKFGN